MKQNEPSVFLFFCFVLFFCLYFFFHTNVNWVKHASLFLLMEPVPRVFDMLLYFEKILPAVEISRQDGVYLIATALLAACDITKHSHHLGRYLGFNQELEIR